MNQMGGSPSEVKHRLEQAYAEMLELEVKAKKLGIDTSSLWHRGSEEKFQHLMAKIDEGLLSLACIPCFH